MSKSKAFAQEEGPVGAKRLLRHGRIGPSSGHVDFSVSYEQKQSFCSGRNVIGTQFLLPLRRQHISSGHVED